MDPMLVALIAVAASFVLPPILVPPVLYAKTRFAKAGRPAPIPEGAPPLPEQPIFDDVTASLADEGFSAAGDYESAPVVGERWVTRMFRDLAGTSIGALRLRAQGGKRLLTFTFYSKLADGSWILTANELLPLSPIPGLLRIARYPTCRPDDLARFHLAALRAAERAGDGPAQPIGEDPIAAGTDASQAQFARLVAAGRFTETADGYRPTLAECYRRYLRSWTAALLRVRWDVPAGARYQRDPRFILVRGGEPLPGTGRRAEVSLAGLLQASLLPIAAGAVPAALDTGLPWPLFAFLVYPLCLVAALVIRVIGRRSGGSVKAIRVLPIFVSAAWFSVIAAAVNALMPSPEEQPARADAAITPAIGAECAVVEPCAGRCADPKRFVRIAPKELFAPGRMIARTEFEQSKRPCPSSPGDLLSRLWALYGAPDDVIYEGFTYAFRDTRTGIVFTADSAGGGPGYGGETKRAAELAPLLREFDAMLAATRPADCQIEYDTDFGKARSGARGGVPFDEIVK